ncbi:MAG: DUF92 domain-containing protein [Spirochaetia bacterium]
MTLAFSIILGVFLNGVAAFGAFYKHAVTISGGIAGFIIGVSLTAFVDISGWSLLMVFFLTSTLLGKYKKAKKAEHQRKHEKGATRDAEQVLANCGAAVIAAAVYYFTGSHAALGAYIAGFAAANADTWASELGILSRKPPVSIKSFAILEPGRSGGVSLPGFVASLAGAAVVSTVGFLWMYFSGLVSVQAAIKILLISTAAGFTGSVIDSMLGAFLQVQYKDRTTGQFTEVPFGDHGSNHQVQGIPWINNDAVNFIASSASVLICAGLIIIL